MSEETTWVGMRPGELTDSQRARLSEDEALRRKHLVYLELGRRMEVLPPPGRVPKVEHVLERADTATQTLSRLQRESGTSHWLFGLPLLGVAVLLVGLSLVRGEDTRTQEEEPDPRELRVEQAVASELTLEGLGSTLMGDRPLSREGGRLEAHEKLLFRVHVLAEGFLQLEELPARRRLLEGGGLYLEPGTHTLEHGWEPPRGSDAQEMRFRAILCPQHHKEVVGALPVGCAVSEISVALGSAD